MGTEKWSDQTKYAAIAETDVVMGLVSGNNARIEINALRNRLNISNQNITGNVVISGDMTATNLFGNGSGLTGIGSGTGGVINTGSTTIGADSDVDSVGIVDIQTRTISRLQILNNGNAYFLQKVGIGTNTATRTLDVETSASEAVAEFNRTSDNDSTIRDLIDFKHTALIPGKIKVSNDTVMLSGTSGVQLAINETAVAYLDTTGFGIGGVPDELLTVKAAQGKIHLESITGTNSCRINMENTGGTTFIGAEGSSNTLATGTTPYAAGIFHNGAYDVQLGTNGTVRMTVDSAGNVGINNNDPDYLLEIGNGSGNILTAFNAGIVNGNNSQIKYLHNSVEKGRIAYEYRTTEANSFMEFRANNIVTCELRNDIPSGYAAMFYHDGNVANRYGIAVQAGADDGSGITTYFDARDGNGDPVGRLEHNTGTFQLVDLSDARLKDIHGDTKINGIESIKAIRPTIKEYTKIKSGEYVPAGFVFQDVLSIGHRAASGELNATEEYVISPEEIDDDGNIVKEAVVGIRDVYGGVAPTRFIPDIIVCQDEIITKIEAIEKRLDEMI
jgi:hypothetical protein